MVVAEMSVSLDGFGAGPAPSLEDPLGKGGMDLHEWVFRLAAWRGAQAAGAVVRGRKMFSSAAGPWEGDPNANGWWGDEPPFRKPVFVVTHPAREPLVLGETTFTFVTEGVEAAVDQAGGA